MNTVLFSIYNTSERAEQIAHQLLDNGFPGDTIRLIGPASHPGGEVAYHDRHAERKGSFADHDPVYHNRNREREGSFADHDPVYHDRHAERKGSFADHDPVYHNRNREREGSFANGMTHQESDEALIARLTDAGLARPDAEQGATHIRNGATLLIIQVPASRAAQAAAIVHQSA